MSDPTSLELLADELETIRREMDLHPQFDGKLSEAEINLRGVASAIKAREGGVFGMETSDE